MAAQMRLLILGGTSFVGRHLAEAALARGDEVTLFNRGRTNPDLFPEAEKLRGDRDGGLAPIDGRDLAAWLLRLADARTTGVFNATNEGVTFGDVLAGADVVWVDDAFLVDQGVGEWMELPLWIADAKFAGMDRADVSRAVAAGLTF